MKMLKNVILLTFLTLTQLFSCAGGWGINAFVKESSYDFLDPQLINLKEENPLYKLSSLSTFAYHERVAYFKNINQALNIKEWKEYLGSSITSKELKELFYGEEDSLLKRYEKLAKKIDNPAFEKYLKFVAYQSSFALEPSSSNTDPYNFYEKGIKNLEEEKEKFLKLRYLFLTMRIAHYSDVKEEYKNELKLYTDYYPQVKEVDSIVFEWIDALRAGALQHLGKDVTSNLLYAKILKNNKTNPYLGYYDFKIENNTQWKELLAQAKSNEEKALFYFLRALKWDGVALKEHRKLAKIAPNSVWFERLTYLIMQDFQGEYLDENSINKNDKYEMANYKSYLEKKAFFLKTLSLLKKPNFFSIYALTYLEIKEHKNLQQIEKHLKILLSLANPQQRVFVKMLSYVNGVRAITSTKKGQNKKLFTQLVQLLKKAPASKRESIFAYTAYYMQKLYPKNSVEQLFSHHCSILHEVEYSAVTNYIDILRAKQFEAYVEKKNRSIYEQKVFRVVMGSLAKNDVAKFLTLLNTKDGNFKKANHYLQQVPKLDYSTKFNPFNVSLSGNNRKVKGKGYGQRKFIKTMLKIQKTLEKNPHSAMDHFLYATGLYNVSWFGNFTQAGSIERSVTHFSTAEAQHILENFKTIEKEYKLALKYAKNPEFKAKIAYQLLKIDYNRFLINNEEESYGVYVGYFKPKELRKSETFSHAIVNYKKNYSHTKYGQYIIKRCATFKYFQ